MALSLALDLVGGPVFDGLSASVSRAMDRDAAFTDLLQHIDHTLKSLKSQAGVINEIKQYNVELGLSTIEIMLLSTKMDNGRALVDRLSRIKFRLLNFFCCCTSNCANKLRELNRELGSLFDTLRLEQIRDVKEIMKLQRQNRDDLDEIKVMVQKILQVIDHPELKGLLNKLGGSMETSTSTSTSTSTLSSASASGSNTEVGVTQATSFEGLVQEAFRLLINVVEEVKESSMMFKPLLLRLKSTLDCLRPFIEEMVQHNKVLDHPEDELEKLRIQMENGVNLIRKCSSVCRWTSNKKDKYTKQVFELDEFLQRQLSILTVKVARDVKGTSELIRDIKEVVKRIEGSDVVQNQDGFLGSCAITEPPIPPVEFQGSCDITEPPVPQERMANFSVDETVTVGLDVPLKELKRELLNDEESSMLVLTGPAGCGKTTLAKNLCQDDEVKVSTVEGTRDVEETMISVTNIEAGVKLIEESGVVQNQLETKELSSDSKPANPDENSSALTPRSKELLEASDDGNGDDNYDDNCDTNSIGSWKDWVNEISEPYQETSTSDLASKSPSKETPNPRMSWANMAQEDELEEEEELNKRLVNVNASTGELRITKSTLPREQREHIRFMSVKRKKDFICLERVNGKYVNILEGLELHTGIFSAAEQKRIVDDVYALEEKGRNGELKARTFTAPRKWMKGKGRVTIQFGCCYNYAVDKNGNPPGILQDETVDPLPNLFKVIIRRLVKWHVLPPTCIPDSCIVNIYEKGDCIPPHIDNHDFVRPFCTVSFLSECNILFGTNLQAINAGEFEDSFAIPLPVGSVLVLNGRGADVAKHCVPAVPTKRISITFRRMEESKRPIWYTPEPDLQEIQPLSYEKDNGYRSISPRSEPRTRRPSTRRVDNLETSGPSERSYSREARYSRSEPRDSTWRGRGSGSRWNHGRGRVNLGS